MMGRAKIGVIILAAGASRRLGFPKQLVEFKGKSLLQHSIDVAELLEFDYRILMLGANAKKIEKGLDIGNFTIIINEEWELGMGTSISKGVSAALNVKSDLELILILLSDQPFVTKEKIQELIREQLENKMPATFSEYAGEVGVPAIFSKETFSDLMTLKKDQGAKKLILDEKISFETIKFEEGIFDVDTAEDVELLKQME
ncbi:nucleotidyltransferase family protein [Salegentibacter agarivorans]|jgi:molybdenum cofactor cytidylyltransferase|uniref:Molybdenum cofactor cytidylyltransferase n=1 Tax=Salegentibacter agarivorans TaxID=345907 RepID=A0A1I2NHW8_9FLAO|nr:nucleotidyltransferase family protein [Salegentibacter agarivorans]SFG01046.1 molybdenum cofactor cytidylyltransferase [Salegentibacter agarivorans]